MSVQPLLAIEDLSVEFPYGHRGELATRPCADLSLSVAAGQVVGLVGASGSGKTMLALAVCGLLPPRAQVVAGSVRLEGEELIGASAHRWREVRGRRIGLVFQDAGRALDPVRTIGHHLREAGGSSCNPAEMLQRVGLARALAARYPHQLSGGQRQRAMIAVATARGPRLLLADEPTSSVDAITQVHVLRELVRAQRELGCGLLIISHDIGVISRVADDVVVLDQGRVVEHGPTKRMLQEPTSEVTRALVVPRTQLPLGPPAPVDASPDAVLALDSVSKRFGKGGGRPAVGDVSLAFHPGETLALVGESGSGKSTLARLAAFMLVPDKGAVTVDGTNPHLLSRGGRRALRQRVQLAHQDVSGALDPRQRVRSIVAEPLHNQRVPRARREERVSQALAAVELPLELEIRRPAQLSGGQRQRVVLARTLVTAPRYLLLDEPVSALDAALVAGSINLLRRLQDERAHGCLIISHDLTAVGTLAHRVAVMYAGEIVETGPTRSVLTDARHPYTQALAAATLVADVDAGLPEIGTLDPPADTGCAYSTRCPSAIDRCHTASPPLLPMNDGTSVRCWLVGVDPTSNQSCPEGASEAG